VKKIALLTGGTGFIGRHLAAQLAARGFLLRYVVRTGRASAVVRDAAFESVIETANLFDESIDRCAEMCGGVDTVVHAAWYAEPGKYLVDGRNFDCLTGSLSLGRGAAIAAVRRFVGLGTCFEYDTSVGRLSVQTPLKPASPYAAAKAATFLTLSAWLTMHRVTFAWCRLFYLHGEGEDGRRLVPYIRNQLQAGLPAELTIGDQVRDFLDVKVAASMIADVANSDAHGAFNICSGVPITVREMAESIADEFGRRDLLQFGARNMNTADPPMVVGEPSMPIVGQTHFASR
jgi:nucleoside-diphosphate-sugar epimerase